MRSIAKAVITVLATISVVSAGITQKKIHDLAQTEVYAQALDYVEPLILGEAESDGFSKIPQDKIILENREAAKLFAESGADASLLKCTDSVDRFRKGPGNYQAVLSAGKPYTDPEFGPNPSSIIQMETANNEDKKSLSKFKDNKWVRAPQLTKEKKLTTLFGTSGVTINDIKQGQLGDCWLLSALISYAMDTARVNKMFINGNTYPQSGLIGMNLRLMHQPGVLTIDDFLPIDSYNRPIFAQGSDDGDYWVALAEKVFAKFFGNYVQLEGGQAMEVWRLLTPAPTQYIFTKDYQNNHMGLFNILMEATKKKYMMMNSMDTAQNGLVGGHAYSIQGAYELKDSKGNVLHRLVRIMNPHGTDKAYTGAWRDNDPAWTADFKKQVPWSNADDGIFYMSLKDYVTTMEGFSVNYENPGWQISTHKVTNSDTAKQDFRFTVKTAQDIYLSVDFVSERMYTRNCKPGSTNALIRVIDAKGNSPVNGQWISDTRGFGWIKVPNIQPGDYTFQVTVQWQSNDRKEYVVGIYSPSSYVITNLYGQTSTNVPQLSSARDAKLKEVMSLISFTGQPVNYGSDKRIIAKGSGSSQVAKQSFGVRFAKSNEAQTKTMVCPGAGFAYMQEKNGNSVTKQYFINASDSYVGCFLFTCPLSSATQSCDVYVYSADGKNDLYRW